LPGARSHGMGAPLQLPDDCWQRKGGGGNQLAGGTLCSAPTARHVPEKTKKVLEVEHRQAPQYIAPPTDATAPLGVTFTTLIEQRHFGSPTPCLHIPKMADAHNDDYETFESAESGASLTYPQQAGTIRKNGYLLINKRPCKVQLQINCPRRNTPSCRHGLRGLTPARLFSRRLWMCPPPRQASTVTPSVTSLPLISSPARSTRT
jgi:hypothetical protein